MKLSEIYKVDLKDVVNGLFTAGFGAIIGVLYSAFQNAYEYGTLEINWQTVAFAAVAAGLAYLQKRYFSNSNGEVKIQ